MTETEKELRFQELRKQAESFLKNQKRSLSSDSETVALKISELLHDYEVHRIELEMQNQELQEAYSYLKEERRRYNNLFDFAPVAYATTNTNGEIVRANFELATLLKLKREKLIGQDFTAYVTQEYKDEYYIQRRKVVNGKDEQRCELAIEDTKGELHFVVMNISFEAGTQLCRMSLTDITSIKKAQESIQRALDSEKELNGLKSRIIEMISHELRTPLTIIQGEIDLLQMYSAQIDDEKRSESYNIIRDHINYLDHIISEAVFTDKYKNKTYQPESSYINLSKFLRSTANPISSAMSRKINISCEMEQTAFDSLIIHQDENLLRQVYVNLLSNAIKYSKEPINVYVGLSDKEFTISIKDSGIGIPEEEQQHILDTFYRASNVDDVSGTGLGLAIANKSLKLMNGRLDVKSKPHQGSTFTVTLPRHLQTNFLK